jgi:16S rRNA processing protein RimM
LIVPFTMACVPTVDIAGGKVVVTPPDEIVVAGEEAA